ncbi:hypothetical protein C8J57DRAFT_1514607 [Mycena rebaudengoi]|nr:hypothetical protein C8J57DRAFT_1514607 [Mycena rebaudengoi]
MSLNNCPAGGVISEAFGVSWVQSPPLDHNYQVGVSWVQVTQQRLRYSHVALNLDPQALNRMLHHLECLIRNRQVTLESRSISIHHPLPRQLQWTETNIPFHVLNLDFGHKLQCLDYFPNQWWSMVLQIPCNRPTQLYMRSKIRLVDGGTWFTPDEPVSLTIAGLGLSEEVLLGVRSVHQTTEVFDVVVEDLELRVKISNADVDRMKLTWGLTTRNWRSPYGSTLGVIVVKIHFDDLRHLDSYLFALSLTHYYAKEASAHFTPSCFRNVGALTISSLLPDLPRFLRSSSTPYPFHSLSLSLPHSSLQHGQSVSAWETGPHFFGVWRFMSGIDYSFATVVLMFSVWMQIFVQCHRLQVGRFILSLEEVDYPATPVIFPDLLFLHISFIIRPHTRFLNHLIFPAIQEFHLAGFLNVVDVPGPIFIPQYMSLRVLVLDVVNLPPTLLHAMLPTLEGIKLTIYVGDCTLRNCEAILDELQPGHFRSLVVATSGATGDCDALASKVAKWVRQGAAANRTFTLYGELMDLLHVEDALRGIGLSTSQKSGGEDAYDVDNVFG